MNPITVDTSKDCSSELLAVLIAKMECNNVSSGSTFTSWVSLTFLSIPIGSAEEGANEPVYQETKFENYNIKMKAIICAKII